MRFLSKKLINNMTDELKATIIKLKDSFLVKQMNDICTYEYGDIDFLIHEDDAEELITFLEEKKFIISKHHEDKNFFAYRYIDQNLYQLDFKSSFAYILNLYPGINWKQNFIEDVWTDPKLEKFFRYALGLRSNKNKYPNFVQKNYDIYGTLLVENSYFSKPIFKQTITCNTLIAAMHKKPLGLLKTFKFSILVKILFKVSSIRIKKIGSGKIVAFVGSDGSGKTTTIQEMKKLFNSPVVHMGDGSRWCKTFFDKFYDKNLLISRLSYFVIYIEHWCRFIKMLHYKWCGRIVLADRWPGTNRHLREKNRWMRLNSLIYRFFPEPDVYIFLSAPAAVIYDRKKDLPLSEIESLQNNLREKLSSRKYVEIETLNYDETYSKVLAVILNL
jgi:thymidylate kinase